MPWVLVFNQIAPWSSAHNEANGGSSAAANAIPVLCEQPQELEAPAIVCNLPSASTYWMLSPK
jgi:hypothetical protein